jgi:hypothetical protein
MKRILFLLMIIILHTGCKSRKVAVSTFKASDESSIDQSGKVKRSTETNLVTTTGSKTSSDSAHEGLSDEGIEFETDSAVTYNSKTGDFKFKPKGKTKFNKKTQTKNTSHQASADSTQKQKRIVANVDSAGHTKKKAKTTNSGKKKDVDAKSDVAGIAAILLIGIIVIGLFAYKQLK